MYLPVQLQSDRDICVHRNVLSALSVFFKQIKCLNMNFNACLISVVRRLPQTCDLENTPFLWGVPKLFVKTD